MHSSAYNFAAMSAAIKEGSIVTPGDELCAAPEFVPGAGVYEHEGVIRSTLCGEVVFDHDHQRNVRVNVVTKGKIAADFVLNVGDKVFCRVIRSNNNQVFVDILAVGDTVLPFASKGVIRREDIREKEIDSIVIYEEFKAGDIVKASIISLGDSKQYYLSTAATGLGVQVRR